MPTRDSFVVEFSSKGATALARTTKTLQGSFASLGRGVTGALGSIAKITGLLSTLTNVGVAVALRNASKSINDIALAGDKLGIAVDRMQTLSQTASLFGGNLDQVVDAIAEMQRRLAETGRLKPEILQAAGFTSEKQALAMRPEIQFETVMRALAKMKNPAMRQFIADEVFGGPAQELMAMFSPRGVEELGWKHRRNAAGGLNITEQDKATSRETLMTFKDAMQSIESVFQKIASSPEALTLVTEFRDAIDQLIKDMGGGKQIAKDFVQAIREVKDAMSLPGRVGSRIGTGLANATMQSTSEIDRIYQRRLSEGKIQVEDRKLNETISGFLRFGIPATVAP